jgi:hypothetical protein
MKWRKQGIFYVVHDKELRRRDLRQPVQVSSAREVEKRLDYSNYTWRRVQVM